MTRLAEGSIIQAGMTQIEQNYQLTPHDEELANILASYIKASKKVTISAVGSPSKITEPYNWIPVCVREHGNRNYQVVGSPVVLEACKKAGMNIVNCLQLDHSSEALQQVEYWFQALKEQTLNGTQGVAPLQLEHYFKNLESRISDLENKLSLKISDLETKVEVMKPSPLPPSQELSINQLSEEEKVEVIKPSPLPQLSINQLSEEELVQKLSFVRGFGGGGQTARKFAQGIIKHRPFTSERELTQAVSGLLTKKKQPSQKFKDLKSTYEIDYSYPS